MFTRMEKFTLAAREVQASWYKSIRGAQLWDPLKTLQYHSSAMLEGFQEGSQMGPHDTETRQSLGRGYDTFV